jgi:ABC-type branched-subunit amino acid transport system substrate-binding protein
MRGLKQWRFLAAAVGLALALGLAACGGDDDDDGGGGGEQSLDLVIGQSLPLTGDLSDFGPPGQKAAQIAEGQINDAAQQAGVDHTVKTVYEDNETNPQAAVQAARKMVDSDGASCIVGAWASNDTIPTAQSVAIPDGVLLISPASTSDEITPLDDNGLVNRTSPPDSFQGPTLADSIAKQFGGNVQGKVVNIGARNDSYGTGLAGSFSDAWENLGGQVGQEVIYDPEQPSYDSEAQQITSGNPDVFVIIDFPETFIKVGPALERTGNWDPTKAWGTDGLASSDLPGDVGAAVVDGMKGTAPGAPEKGEASTAFDELYTSSPPPDVERQTFDAQTFDGEILCYLAAVSAGSTDGQDMADALVDITKGGQSFTWQQLPDLINALQNGDDVNYVGASGEIDMDENGDATAGVYDIYQYKGESLDIISEVPVLLPGQE